jgi:hypothetical protein
MIKVVALIFILSSNLSCFTSPTTSDVSFFKALLLSNLQKTPYTAHIRIAKTEKRKEIYSDSGEVGYIIFKVTADVLETFKGEKFDEIEYSIFQEAPSKGPLIGNEWIVSLHYSEEKDEYYIPDNGYVLPVIETLKNTARSESR